MTNIARVIRVFISSPDDVSHERSIVRELIYDWNSTFSIINEIVLLPVGWDKELGAGYGSAPQAKVNEELLPYCELLIAIFGAKIGTSTEEHLSGTIEEIERHTLCEKEAFLFFKDLDVKKIDNQEEYQKVLDYKRSIQDKCVYLEYESIEDFENKLRNQINLYMQKQNEADWKLSIERSLPNLDHDAQILKYIIDQWGMRLELESMKDWIAQFTSSVFRLNQEKYYSLQELMLWMLDRIWGEGNEEFEETFVKFASILSDMLMVINGATYLNKEGHCTLKHILNDQNTFDYMLKTNEFNKYLIMDYAAELCRATNFILDLYRKKVNPLYLAEFGRVYIVSGPRKNLKYAFLLLEYHDTNVIPYNGYDDFLESRTERDYSFGAGKNIEDPVFEEWFKQR